MSLRRFRSKLAVSVVCAVTAAGCSTMSDRSQGLPFPKAAPAEDVLLADQALGGGKKFVNFASAKNPIGPFTPDNGGVVVELDQQRAYVYQKNRLVAVSRIASGRANHRTETGDYTIGQKKKDHRSNIYGDFVDATGSVIVGDVDTRLDKVPEGAVYRGASMANFCRLYHEGKATPIGFHRGFVPNRPASHGCIRLPAAASEYFFENLPIGLPVIIRGEKYGVPFGTKQRGSGQRPPKTMPTAAPVTPPGDGTETNPGVGGMPNPASGGPPDASGGASTDQSPEAHSVSPAAATPATSGSTL